MKYNEKTKQLLCESLPETTKLLPEEVIDYLCGALEDPMSSAGDDLLELRDIVAPHLIDVGLLGSDAAVLSWLKTIVQQLVDAGVVTRASGSTTLLDAPVDISADGTDGERNLFIDREDRLGLVNQEQLAAASEKYLKRKQLRLEKQNRIDEKKKASSLLALRSLQEEQQKGACLLACERAP